MKTSKENLKKIVLILFIVATIGILFIIKETGIVTRLPSNHAENIATWISGNSTPPEKLSPVEMKPDSERDVYDRILLGAREEVYNKTRYDAGYYSINYPGGDVQSDRGACSDVVVRALRNGGFDLQKLMHEDMKNHFNKYPQLWDLSGPDPNIDHRRVANQMVFFRRHGVELSTATDEENIKNWQHGNIICWRFANGQLHTGIVSDLTNPQGIPLVIHNSWMAVEEDHLKRWEIIGHFRYPPED